MKNSEKFDRELAWVRRHMTRTQRALDRLPSLEGMRLACSIHLDIKMAPLIEALLERGAEVFLTTCNPSTVRNEVVDYLAGQGAAAQAWHGMPRNAFRGAIGQALAWQPTHFCEMGAELSAALYAQDKGAKTPVQASLEATGSGVTRLRALPLDYPVFNWDDLPIKERLHNRYMVGLTTWQTFFQVTHLSLHELHVVVVGFGLVGQGVAATARAFGGRVTVAEQDPARALEARYNGWNVQPLDEALPTADVVVTATGAHGVLGSDQFERLPDGAFILNVGHLAAEIDVDALYEREQETVLDFVEAINWDGKTLYLLAGGSMFNLTAGWGDSLNAFDVTLAILAAGIGHIAGEGAEAEPGVHLLPRAVWEPIL